MLRSVGHLESDLNQKLISSSTLMEGSCWSSTNLWANIGFGHILWSVGHLEPDLDQKFISSSPPMKYSTCETKLKYLHQFLRYFGDRQKDKQTQAKPSPTRKAGGNKVLQIFQLVISFQLCPFDD